jgi:methyl-accepting chemotaxis protein
MNDKSFELFDRIKNYNMRGAKMSTGTGKLANKFLGLGVAIAIAIAVPIVPLLKSFSDQIGAAEKEISGVAVHRELRLVLQDIQRHRGASTSLLSGKSEFKERADKARTGVGASIEKVEQALAANQESLGVVPGWTEFKARWQNLKSSFSTYKPAENVKAHNEAVGGLLEVMGAVADVSGLVLDPDLDSYYAMDLAVLQLPPATERMGQGRALGALILSDKNLTQERRDAMIGAFSEMRLREKAILADAQKIFAANATAAAQLKGAFEDTRGGIARFIDNVDSNILKSEILSYEPTRYFDEATQAIDVSFKLYDLSIKTLDEMLQARISGIKKTRLFVLLVAAVIFGIAAFLAFVILRGVNRSVLTAVNALDRIAEGRLDVALKRESNDEIGHLVERLDDMQTQLKTRLEAERQIANENLRIKVALDGSTNSVMVADTDGKIIYCNSAVIEMMRRAESDIRKQLPNFRADAILGSSFDIYHRNPSHQRNLLGGLTSAHRADLSIGGRHFGLVATPILNANGQRLGSSVEWLDRTAEVLIENEVSSIINAAATGDFSRRLDASKMNGFYKQISEGINRLLEANTRALEEVGAMFARLAQGDLTEKIDSDYQGMLGVLKNDANATVDNLQEIIFSIKEATDLINTAAKEIASGNQDLSSRTEEQASSLEETASSMEQLTSTVKQNADNARQANELAGNAQQVAIKGGEVVGQVVDTMSAIHQSSSKIADIIGVIDGIAFQTNILALNAAVEAARAGEQGRGFAVVATEVRNLAQRSAAAAKEIKGLISDSVEKVETGNKLVDQAGRTMEEVVTSIKRVARIMGDISDASREQSSGIEQVSLAVSQMDEVTQQNAALVEEAAAAAESLEEQAHNLAQAVSVFSLARSSHGPTRAEQIEPRQFARPALPHKEPVRLKSSPPKSDIRVPRNGDEDEWAEF